MMDVIVEKGVLGWPVYHIFDIDGRDIACHRADVVELIHILKEALRKEKDVAKLRGE